MNISRTRFVFVFLISAFVFQFASNSLFGSDIGMFPQPPESWLGTRSPVAWKNIGSTIVLPIKIVLFGPMLPFPNFLRDDPPPPFVAIIFAFYWTILALAIHYLLGKIKGRQNAQVS